MSGPIGSLRVRLRGGLERPGLAPRGERRFRLASTIVVALFAFGWAGAIVETARAGTPADAAPAPLLGAALTANPLSRGTAAPAAFLIDQAMTALAGRATFRGHSGAVDVILADPGDSTLTVPGAVPPNVQVGYGAAAGAADTVSGTRAPEQPGIWNVVLRLGEVTRAVPGMSVITLVPFSAKQGGRIGGYLLGTWPFERGGKPKSPAYFPPRGFVQVTPQNEDLHLTDHIRLRDYITKGQVDVWPKYIAVSPKELDKIELTIQQLEREGHPVARLGVISAFRNPNYNYTGGNTEGRAQLSRHMYGDAMDVFVDNGHGCMADLTGDGRTDVNDARVIANAAQRVEQLHPDLVGGIGVYAPTSAHCGFVHIDTRGFRARWGAW